MADALYCTSMGHENEPAAGIVRLGDTRTDHPHCQACIDTLCSNPENEFVANTANTLVRMLVDAAERTVIVRLGDGGPYPPPVDDADADALRRWIGSNLTLACFVGDHTSCSGMSAFGSKVVEPRPCLCPHHAS